MGRQFYINTITNYLSKVIKIVGAYFTTKALVTSLDQDFYGLWSLLWMIFGYSLLFDFGLGMAAQKAAANFKSNKNIKKLNEIINTTFIFYSFISILIIVWTMISAQHLELFISSEVTSSSNFKELYIEFGLLSAIVFPTGFFKELLTGVNRIDLRNYVLLIYEITNLALILIICLNKLPFVYLIRSAIVLILLSNIILFLIFKLKTGCRLFGAKFNFKIITQNLNFNLCAYTIMCSNLIILKTDQLILSSIGTLSLVASYQIASRIPHLMKILTDQFQENLIPLTIKYKNKEDTNSLRNIYIQSTKYNQIIATCFASSFLFSSSYILKIWLEITDPIIINTTNVIIISTYVITIAKSVNSNMLLMLNQHAFLAKVNIAEALINLILTIILVQRFGIIGAAYGTLIPQIFLALTSIIPKASSYFSIGQVKSFYVPLSKTLCTAILPTAYLILYLNLVEPDSLLKLIIGLLQYGLFYLVLSFRFLVSKREREIVVTKVSEKLALLKNKVLY